MFNKKRSILGAAALAATAAIVLAGCATGDPTSSSSSTGSADSGTVSIGSAGFAESTIIAEIYAQALENADITVERTFEIGSREVYLKALDDGSINLIPDYTGNLLLQVDPEATAKTADEITAALPDALPENLEILEPSAAENKDSYNVTKQFSEENNVTSLADLAGAGVALKVGGAPELETRSYGPQGLTDVYGVAADTITFQPIKGTPLTVASLKDGTVNIADIYTTEPGIDDPELVTLEDPENLIIAQNIVPLIAKDAASDEVTKILNEISAKLTTDDLIALNARNQGDEKASPETLATDWLKEAGLVK